MLGRRRVLLLAVVLPGLIVTVVLAVSVLSARASHNRELESLRERTMRAMALMGVAGRVVTAGVDGGGEGSADCGVHVVVAIDTDAPPREVFDRFQHQSSPIGGALYRDSATGGLALVTQDVAATGADSWLDLRCSGATPYAADEPVGTADSP